ncbi:hypothetical protein KM92CIT3_40340 [uncultured Citrobacter sp.]|uniref:Uncharacterized protein n=1 Tax=uncultured Citrobacter sp. TaxID=200446 RepID=A0A212IBR1_9ENTR|nr:hypothetical protein KL86CIT2_290080 [uncultured Citrobacter sp.]SBV64242.1 hypothetical protein KM92CIT3_40340 [uncultured Citrobacter sp.]
MILPVEQINLLLVIMILQLMIDIVIDNI